MWNGSADGITLAFRLSQLRSAVRVGLALAEKCPTEESWDLLMQNPDIQETLSAFAAIVEDIQQDLNTATPDTVMHTVLNHHGRTLEVLEPFCEHFGIEPDDLFVVLSA